MIKKYVFVNSVDNTVFTTMIFDTEENQGIDNIVEGMSSSPLVMEVSPTSRVEKGWVLNNGILVEGDSNV